MRIAKYLAHAGIASRRAAESLVRDGRVTVDGETVTDLSRLIAPGERLALDGRPVDPPRSDRLVIAVHKPLGVVSTASDPQGRPTVTSLAAGQRRLYPVGRLDIDTTGLILLTDDGELAHRLTHPRYEVPKTYRATVPGPVPDCALRALRAGIRLEDGPTAPARVRRVSPDTLEITIHEGRNRQVRRMCQAVGQPVVALQRIAFGPLTLGSLPPGAHRQLEQREVAALSAAASVRPVRASSRSAPAPPAAD